MNFLGMGPGELLLIAALGLIVFGPGKLPEIAAQVGKAVRDFRRSTSEISSEFHSAFSLDPPPPPPAPDGPAAPFATNGTADAAAPAEPAPTAASSEPALVDTSDWHWESAPAAASSLQSAPAAEPAASSMWEWAEGETESAVWKGDSARADGAAATDGTVWQWDAEETAPNSAAVAAAADPAAPVSQTGGATGDTSGPRPRRKAAPRAARRRTPASHLD